ncbi:MAG: metallophosphoesterase [Candidatus Pacearchaeota archaeon]|jgi:hypothetical protein
MKILAISDIHGDAGLVRKLAKQAKKENVDLVIIAGDLTWFGNQAKEIIQPFIKEGKQVITIPGNHDPENISEDLEQVYKGTINLHKKSFSKEDIGFFGTGTTDWGFYEDGKQVYKELSEAHKKIKDLKKKIMVVHCPPEGSKIELMGFPGSRGVRKAIDKFKPDFVICGHIHQGGGLFENIDKSKVMNVARRARIFEI